MDRFTAKQMREAMPLFELEFPRLVKSGEYHRVGLMLRQAAENLEELDRMKQLSKPLVVVNLGKCEQVLSPLWYRKAGATCAFNAVDSIDGKRYCKRHAAIARKAGL